MLFTLVRGRRHRTGLLAIAAFVVALSGCGGKAMPPGFPAQGTHWAIPIFGALGDGTPLAPVTLGGKGPYLFAVDVNAPSAIDPRLARELGLEPVQGQAAQPGAAAPPPSVSAPRVELGNLTLAPVRFEMRDVRVTHHGRPVQGSIGREILHPSLLWILDRDRQSLYLGAREQQGPPAGSQRVDVRPGSDGSLRIQAQIAEGATATLRMSFEPQSAIRPELAEKAGLRPIGERAWMAGEVRVGEASASEILFSAFGEAPAASPPEPEPGMPEAAVAGGAPAPPPEAPVAAPTAADAGVDGVLGQRFWSRFLVAMFLQENALWLKPRVEEAGALTAERLARWATLFDGCQSPACVTLAVVEPGAVPAPPEDPAAKPGDENAAKPGDKNAAKPGDKNAAKPGDKPDKNAGKGNGNQGDKGKAPEPEAPASNHLVVTRDPGKKDQVYDVLLQAFDDADAPLPAPYVLVALPKGVSQVSFALTAIAPAYERAASFRVVDATPFPPPCRDKQGCVWLQR
jgi:hypothetical protein